MQVADVGMQFTYPVSLYGVTPYIMDAGGKGGFVEVEWQGSGLKEGAQLYTARGGQGVGIDSYLST